MNFVWNNIDRPVAKWIWLALILACGPVLWLIFDRSDDDFFYIFGPQLLVGLIAYRLHLRRLAQKTNESIEAGRVHLATVEALATAIDARDQIGAGHVRRVQIFAVGIGKILGCSENEINALRTGALLHDIGKLAVPDHILNKPGSLTPAELEKTKIHAQVGASILDSVGFKYPVVPTVKHHHECWDGRGYPDGLIREEIPLTARILAAADAFDTLRGARPYRPARTRNEALRYLLDASGTRFDPLIVQTLIGNLAALEAEINAQGLAYEETEAPSYEPYGYVEQIKRANREVFSLYELAREFSSSVELHETLDLFANKVGEFVPFDTCSLYLLDDSKSFATASRVEGRHAELLAMRRIVVGQGATGHALKTREIVRNMDPDLDFVHSQTELAGEYLTMASIPLIADDEIIGAVTIYSREHRRYGEEHIRLLETISRIAADAIDKSLKHDEATTNALTDPMTGLPNARSLQLQFEKEVARADRNGTEFQMLMLDLDRFKAVNDSFGHKAGDEMLREISRVIRAELRDYDFLARYGGDEFVALITDTKPDDVLDLCGRIEKAVSAFSLTIDGERHAAVGVSLGSSGYPRHGSTFDKMIVAADKAMYRRKTSRKQNNPAPGQVERSRDGHMDNLQDNSLSVELNETLVISSSAVN